MNFPDELRYSADHEWVRLQGEEAVIGITDFAQSELGDIVFVDVDKEGENLKAGEVFGSIEAVKTVSDLMMPIAAEVLELNPALEENPELVNKEPYGQGWIIRVKPANPKDIEGLMSAEDYKKHIAK
ncbi:MAG: glycine cleavage system protein H [Candidatus [Bacteroides] periocalifornicus]|uniref:Glycine cleavage system H protein n=1 Tax=Candidatus [Bacteroides] periocalifornicus TaxID=1702214 RepID=A0A0Q4B520_9BACT|nr:MAG: glycine cleavage system protein H [Candidatus [Bacteroides] periocalifornicus]